MRVLYAIILLFPLIIIFALSYLKYRDFFSPLCICSFFMFIKYVPSILGKDYEFFTELNLDNTYKVTIMQLIAITCVLIGYFIGSRIHMRRTTNAHKNEFINLDAEDNEKNRDIEFKQWKIIMVYFIGMMARIRIIVLSGGISSILGNISKAYAGLSNGTGFLSLLSNCVIISAMLQLYIAVIALRNHENQLYKKRMFILIIMVTLYSVSFLVFSSRSPVLELGMYLLFGYNYLFKKFKIQSVFNIKSVIIIGVGLAILFLMPQIRKSSYSVAYRFDKLSGRYTNEANIFEEFADEFSVVGRDAFVYDHFNSSNYWHGRSLVGIATAFIPYSLYPKKPPVDDGLYLSNMMYGFEVTPPASRDRLIVKYSVPFTTPGSMYANFGVVGVMIGEILVGYLYAKAYGRVLHKLNVFNIILYQLIIYQFELTTLSIMQTLMPLIISYLVFYVLTKGRYSLIKLRRNR